VSTWVIVPIKPLNRSKSRLAPVLDIKQRESLSREMLERTLMTLNKVKIIAGVMVVSRDTGALSLAREYGVQTLQESGAPELNASLTRATQVVGGWGAGGVLVLSSDIPLMRTSDIEGMLRLGTNGSAVVAAPDRRGEGTNALLVRPPGLIPYRFGDGSLEKHLSEARAAGVAASVYESKTLGLDVDIPADLDLYREMLVEREIREPAWLTSL
jgi:2-phospho-L-lactate guanylyltransferase